MKQRKEAAPPAEPQLARRLPRLRTVNQLHDVLGGALTTHSIYAQLAGAEERTLANGSRIPANGLAPAIYRVGARILVDLDSYLDWLEAHRLAPAVDLDAAREAPITAPSENTRPTREAKRKPSRKDAQPTQEAVASQGRE